jgi:hypothetical protein
MDMAGEPYRRMAAATPAQRRLTFALCRAAEGAQRRSASVGHQRAVRSQVLHLHIRFPDRSAIGA